MHKIIIQSCENKKLKYLIDEISSIEWNIGQPLKVMLQNRHPQPLGTNV